MNADQKRLVDVVVGYKGQKLGELWFQHHLFEELRRAFDIRLIFELRRFLSYGLAHQIRCRRPSLMLAP